MRTQLLRSALLFATVAFAGTGLVACGGERTGPTASPASITAQGGNNQTATAGQPLATSLSVLVTDAADRPIKGITVNWNLSAAAGILSPASSVTNGNGIATTVWTLGPTAGQTRVTAQVGGLNPVTFTATVLAAAPASVVASPKATTIGVGDTLRVRAAVRDAFGNSIASQTITFTSLDAPLATVTSTGLVTALAQGTARIVADAGGRADTVPVVIGAAGSSVCGTTSPTTLAVGEVRVPTAAANGVSVCLGNPVGVNGEYALTLINTGSNFGTGVYVDVVGLGNTGPTTVALTDATAPTFDAATPAATIPVGAAVDDRNAERAAELARRERSRTELAPLVDDARAWYADRGRIASVVATPNVGDEIKLNANANQSCSNVDLRTGRVMAVSNRAMVVADVANPGNGYTDADYQQVLATFDTLIFPMDTTAFGAPSNMSAYGRIILFYTKAVNELTPRGASFSIGGFFFSRDLYPKKATKDLAACAGSNESEMFYLLVPDPNGEVNGNRRSKDDVTTSNLATIAHELQHLINASRRLYVNTTAVATEETWLDEGLSHIAEELLYFRISGFGTRQNLGLPDISASSTRLTQFNTYSINNFARFSRFLSATEINSPYAPNDSLTTRGAIWNFLRFAAARQGASGEASFLRSVVNSRSSGLANLQSVLTPLVLTTYLSDWTVSLIADDFSFATTAALDPRYINPAWNFRSIYPGLRTSSGSLLGVYPIGARQLSSNVPQRLVLAGGTSGYVRFGIPSGRSAFLQWSTNGQTLPATMRWALVRLR